MRERRSKRKKRPSAIVISEKLLRASEKMLLAIDTIKGDDLPITARMNLETLRSNLHLLLNKIDELLN